MLGLSENHVSSIDSHGLSDYHHFSLQKIRAIEGCNQPFSNHPRNVPTSRFISCSRQLITGSAVEADLKNGGLAQRLIPASCLYGLQVGPACNEATGYHGGLLGGPTRSPQMIDPISSFISRLSIS